MFIGAINAHLRAIIAEQSAAWAGLPVYVGCSGNFTIERIIAGRVGAIHSNDVSIYSCALGWALAGESRDFRIIDSGLAWAQDYCRPGLPTVAAMLLLAEMLKFHGDNAYGRRMFAHYRSNFLSLHQKTLERVSRAVEGVRVKFYAGDCRDFMAQADKNGIAVCFPPTYRGGYESLYKRLDAIFEWSKPTYRVFAETDIESFAMQMSGFRHFLVSFDKPIAPLADRQIAVVQTTLRSHPVYVYGSQGARRVALPHQRVGTPRYAPRCDDVIEPIEVVLTDVPTMNTWRSQYLAKQITPSDAMRNYAVLSAGKVIGAFSVCLMKYEKPGAGFIYLLSDFAVRPSPHKRLSKLILACVLSTEVQADLEQWLCQRVENIRTTAFTAKAVSMKYRGLFEVHNREEGMINYDAPAGRWSIKDGFQWWMKNHGCKRSTPNCPAPACAAT